MNAQSDINCAVEAALIVERGKSHKTIAALEAVVSTALCNDDLNELQQSQITNQLTSNRHKICLDNFSDRIKVMENDRLSAEKWAQEQSIRFNTQMQTQSIQFNTQMQTNQSQMNQILLLQI